MNESPAIVATLEKATEGLEMPSETDAPFRVVFYPLEAAEAEALTPEKIAGLAGAPEGAEVETRELGEFFEAAATVEDWMNEEEKATAQRFADLQETLQSNLQDVQVALWGEAEKQVAIAGKTEGGIAAVVTVVVET